MTTSTGSPRKRQVNPTLTTDQLSFQVLSALQQVHTHEEAEHGLANEVARLHGEGYPKPTAQLWASEFARRLIERDSETGPTVLSQQAISSIVDAVYGGGTGRIVTGAAGVQNRQGDEFASEQTREDQLYDIAKRDLLLYKDSAGMFWVGLPQKDDSYLHIDLNSSKVSNFLHARYKRDYGTVIRGEAVRNVLATIQGDLAEESETHDNFVRLAWLPESGKLYVDLHGNKAAEIDATGWRVVEGPPVYFRRPSGVLPQVEPERGGQLEALREILGLEDERPWRLLVGFLLSAFHPTGPYPVLVLSGEQGTGKSTAAMLLGRLIDPNKAQLEKAPTREDDIPVQAVARHLLAWDNLSTVPPWFSDALCGLATELTQSRRKLYSDADLYVFNATKPTLINGIEDLATRPDLLNRALLVQLEKMPEAKRKEREVVLAAFEKARPALLGAVFDAVSCAMRHKDRIRIKNAPRMADMAYWVTQAEPALGWAWGSYMQAFQHTVEQASSIALESSPLAQGLVQWLAHHEAGFAGYAAALLDELNTSWGIDNEVRFRKGWPKLANYLTNNLRRIAPELRKQGWDIDIDRKSQGAYVTIRQAVNDGSATGSDAIPEVIVLDEALEPLTARGVPSSSDANDGHDDTMRPASVQQPEKEEVSTTHPEAVGTSDDRQERHYRQEHKKTPVDAVGFDALAWLATDVSDVDNEGKPIAVCPTCGQASGSNPLTCLECEVRVLLDTENARCRHQGAYATGIGDGVMVYAPTGGWRTVTTTQTCADCGKAFYCEAPEEHQADYWVPFGCSRCDNAVLMELGRAEQRLDGLRTQAHIQRAQQLVERTVCEICGAPAWPNELCPMHLRFELWREQQPTPMAGGDLECGHEDIHEEGDTVVICDTCGGRWECAHSARYEKSEGGFGCPDCFYIWTEQNTNSERLAELRAEVKAAYGRGRE